MFLRKIPGLSKLLAALDALHREINRLYRTIDRLGARVDTVEVLTRVVTGELIKESIAHGVSGVTRAEENQPNVVISLTTYPARIEKVILPVYSLLRQTYKPSAVVLWLAQSQFPAKENDLPRQLLELKNIGLTINWCEDIKSFKKIIPSLREYPDRLIATADDDIYYRPDWLEQLVSSYKETPNIVHAHRCHRISLDDNDCLTPYHSWERNAPLGLQPSQLNSGSFHLFLLSGGGSASRRIKTVRFFWRAASTCLPAPNEPFGPYFTLGRVDRRGFVHARRTTAPNAA